jgi:hypothetical protein
MSDLAPDHFPLDLRPQQSAAAFADEDAFALIAEIADLVHGHADELADAAVRGDRARVRLYACQLARDVRSALLTVNDILIEAERNRP